MKFDIPVSYLRAAVLFAAKQDVRYHLIGINLVSRGDGSGQLQATDGHRAVVMRLTGMPAGYQLLRRSATMLERNCQTLYSVH